MKLLILTLLIGSSANAGNNLLFNDDFTGPREVPTYNTGIVRYEQSGQYAQPQCRLDQVCEPFSGCKVVRVCD